jgi:integrase
VELTFFSGEGWESWDVEARPAIPDGMPVLVDDDLLFDGGRGPRPSVAVNRWLRELPSSGAPSAGTWAVYARVLRDWMAFCAGHGTDVLGRRAELKAVLGTYAAYRADGPEHARFAARTWNRHVSVLSCFYQWAMAEGYVGAVPFSYAQTQVRYGAVVRETRVNLAHRRAPKPHVTVRHLEADFAALFIAALGGRDPDGLADPGYRGRELARNAAIGQLALATGLRRQEFSYLLVYEIPPLPSSPGPLPVPFPVPAGVSKGRKYRTTWADYESLQAVHQYAGLDRAAVAAGSRWQPPQPWGQALLVSGPDETGGRINGRRVRWDQLGPGERRRLVAPDGGACMLALRSDGGPFTAWNSVFTRASDRIRRFEPRFPHVSPHRLRHTFALATLERLVSGYYEQAAGLAKATETGRGPDAALALYLTKADPMMVLRDLLGHSSVVTTEAYLRRLDMTRIYADAYERAGRAAGLIDAAAEREADEEFGGERDADDLAGGAG